MNDDWSAVKVCKTFWDLYLKMDLTKEMEKNMKEESAVMIEKLWNISRFVFKKRSFEGNWKKKKKNYETRAFCDDRKFIEHFAINILKQIFQEKKWKWKNYYHRRELCNDRKICGTFCNLFLKADLLKKMEVKNICICKRKTFCDGRKFRERFEICN